MEPGAPRAWKYYAHLCKHKMHKMQMRKRNQPGNQPGNQPDADAPAAKTAAGLQ